MKNKIIKKLGNKDGNVTIIVAFAMVMLLVCVALVVDISLAYTSKAKHQNALDASAFAGAQDLPDTGKARESVEKYLIDNSIDLLDVDINIPEDGKEIEIDATHEVEYYFAKVMGVDSGSVHVHTKVIVGPLKSMKKMRPFSLEKEQVKVTGEKINLLKIGSGGGESGDFGFIRLGGKGADILNDNVIFGYQGLVNKDDEVDVEPGNIASVVADATDYVNSLGKDHPDRLWPIPIVEIVDAKTFKVVGFALFFVEEIKGKAAKAEINGKFVDWMLSGEVDPSGDETGVFGMQLVE